jgi:hypothetical protein
MPIPPAQRGQLGGLTKSMRTVDRTEATRNAREAGPAYLQYHLDRLGPEFALATEEQRLAAAEAAQKLFYARMAMKSAAVRSKKAG